MQSDRIKPTPTIGCGQGPADRLDRPVDLALIPDAALGAIDQPWRADIGARPSRCRSPSLAATPSLGGFARQMHHSDHRPHHRAAAHAA